MSWVAKEVVSSKRLGKSIYFRRWCGIGPECTPNIDEAMKFDTERCARSIYHSLCFFEPEEIQEVGHDTPVS